MIVFPITLPTEHLIVTYGFIYSYLFDVKKPSTPKSPSLQSQTPIQSNGAVGFIHDFLLVSTSDYMSISQRLAGIVIL